MPPRHSRAEGSWIMGAVAMKGRKKRENSAAVNWHDVCSACRTPCTRRALIMTPVEKEKCLLRNRYQNRDKISSDGNKRARVFLPQVIVKMPQPCVEESGKRSIFQNRNQRSIRMTAFIIWIQYVQSSKPSKTSRGHCGKQSEYEELDEDDAP